MVSLGELETIAIIASCLVRKHIYEDWEGTGKIHFDPFGEYQPALIKALKELRSPE